MGNKKEDNLINWRKKNLDPTSESFCAAKWYNVSIHFGHGFNNSCHLPLPHPIDLDEIKDNPSALHNTKLKKSFRKMMLKGKRPAECSYCWKIEDIGRDNPSDRIFKSQIYSEEEIKEISNKKWDEDVLPKTIEISFDRYCNFACSYCNAGYSTKWGQDIQTNGGYQKFKSVSSGAYQTDGTWADKYKDDNPFLDAFIKWYPELIPQLQELRITGGEPIVSPNFWRFLDVVKKHPSEKLGIAINSNLGDVKLTNKLIKITHDLPISRFDLYTSNESYGPHAEYIRDGLIYSTWRKNMVNFIEQAEFRSLTIMLTINGLSLFSITEFMEDMLTLKAEYGINRPNMDFNILRWPAFMSPLSLPKKIKEKQHHKLKSWFEKNKNNPLLSVNELGQIERLIDYIDVVKTGHTTTESELDKHFHDFKSFHEQYDKRRGKDIRKTFPEIVDWYDSIVVDQTIPDVKVTDGAITHYETGEYDKNGGK